MPTRASGKFLLESKSEGAGGSAGIDLGCAFPRGPGSSRAKVYGSARVSKPVDVETLDEVSG